MADITTTEGREELRRRMETMPHSEGLHAALDLLDRQEKGLDIAKEMAERLRAKGHRGQYHTDNLPQCTGCAALAKWDTWKEEGK